MPLLDVLRGRGTALGVLSTGVVCPCHALVGVAGLLMGGALLTPAEQDGIHAVYVPGAVLLGALLLRGSQRQKLFSERSRDLRRRAD